MALAQSEREESSHKGQVRAIDAKTVGEIIKNVLKRVKILKRDKNVYHQLV